MKGPDWSKVFDSQHSLYSNLLESLKSNFDLALVYFALFNWQMHSTDSMNENFFPKAIANIPGPGYDQVCQIVVGVSLRGRIGTQMSSQLH